MNKIQFLSLEAQKRLILERQKRVEANKPKRQFNYGIDGKISSGTGFISNAYNSNLYKEKEDD